MLRLERSRRPIDTKALRLKSALEADYGDFFSGSLELYDGALPPREHDPRNAESMTTGAAESTGFEAVGLFAGIGGLELGLARAGHQTSLLCEIELAAKTVLADRFPDIALHSDVCKLRALPTQTRLLVAGFPCQDLSQAGKTVGIEGARSGLVGEVFRLLRKQRVPWVVLENVPFMLQLSRGRAMDVIVSAFEELGYKWAFRVIDSRAFGVPQRRARVYFVASCEGDPRDVVLSDDVGAPIESIKFGDVACGFYWTEGIRGLGWAVDAVPTLKGGSTVGIPSQPAILFPDGRVTKPDIRDAERMQGFIPDWSVAAEKVTRKGARWKLVGNAVTVDAAAWIGQKLIKPKKYDARKDALLERIGSWPHAAWGDGTRRFVSTVSAWPVSKARPHLEEFLKYPTTPLSAKATAGFLSRASTGTLRFPDNFIATLERHLARMRKADPKAA